MNLRNIVAAASLALVVSYSPARSGIELVPRTNCFNAYMRGGVNSSDHYLLAASGRY